MLRWETGIQALRIVDTITMWFFTLGWLPSSYSRYMGSYHHHSPWWDCQSSIHKVVLKTGRNVLTKIVWNFAAAAAADARNAIASKNCDDSIREKSVWGQQGVCRCLRSLSWAHWWSLWSLTTRSKIKWGLETEKKTKSLSFSAKEYLFWVLRYFNNADDWSTSWISWQNRDA